MKRTLFLALTLVAAASASATIATDKGKYSINTQVGTDVLTPDNMAEVSAGLINSVMSVGTYAGEGHLTLSEGTELHLPNALMIGGKGYGMPQTTASNGTVVVEKDALITVGNKSTSSGGHHVDVGNSGYACEGLLTVKGGTVNTGQTVIGLQAGEGTVVVTDGGSLNMSWDGITPQQNPANDQIGLTMGGDGGKGHLIIDKGTVTDTTDTNAFLGAGGDASVELKNGGVFESNSDVWMGDIWNGAYGKGEGTDTLTVQAGSSFSCNMLWADKDSAITNEGALSTTEELYLVGGTLTNSGEVNAAYVELAYGSSLDNSGTIHADELGIYSGTSFANSGLVDVGYIAVLGETATNSGTMGAEDGVTEIYLGALDNTGTIQGKAVVVGSESSLITGTLVVNGCETDMQPAHEMQTSYATGIADGTAVVLDPNGAQDPTNVTIGARVNGGDTMQYLYSKDFRNIDATVLDSLNLQVVTAHDEDGIASAWEALSPEHADKLNVKVANVIGDNISANVTTDDAHDGGDITVALSGSHLVVRVGDNGAADPTAEDKKASAEKVGTLGSYQEDVAETDASVRLHTTATQSTVEWEGHYMETVRGETSVVNDTTRISVGSDGVEGTLTVVEQSTLQNHGDVASDKIVVNGTLDNNGTVSSETTVNGTLKGSGVMAATTLAETATLIVGNSPGYSTFTDALMAQSGSTVVFSVSGLETPSSLTAGTGWDSHTYSQIVMENGAGVTLCEGVNITIAFGGDELCSAVSPLHEETLTPFELILIKGGVASTVDLVSLMDHTSFVLTNEAGALPFVIQGQTWAVNVANAAYRVEEGNLILSGTLSVTRTPEPATATLSLLALAALASRRRRR